MSLTDTIFGTPGTTNFVKSGGSAASPGYNFAKSLYQYLPSIFQQQFPTYNQSIDPGLSPTVSDAIRRAQGYAASGPSEILQGAQGTLGSFMNQNFINPWNAMMTQAPNYGGANMNQRVHGGQPAGSYGSFAGGNQGYGGQGFAAGEPTPGGGSSSMFPSRDGGMRSFPPLGGGMPGGGFGNQPPSAPGQTPQGGGQGFESALGMNWNDAQKSLAQQFAGNPNGLNSALAGRYGMNQYGQQNDGRQQFMHSTDHLSALQRILGREPSYDEVQQSLRSGAGNIEQARGLFMQDYNGSGDWGSGQKSYADLVNQHGLAKGSQMFEQQYGNGPMWAGGAPGQAPSPTVSTVPPLGGGMTTPTGPPSGPIMAPGRGAQPMGSGIGGSPQTVSTVPPGDPMNGGMNPVDPMAPGGGAGTVSVLPSSPATTPASLPPLGAKPGQTYGGYTTAQLNANPALADKLGANARGRLGLPPLGGGAKGPTDIGIAKPVNRRPNEVVDPRPATPTTQRPDGPKFVAGEPPKPVLNPRTGNWHTPGAGERRQHQRFVRNGGKYVY